MSCGDTNRARATPLTGWDLEGGLSCTRVETTFERIEYVF